MKIRTTQLGIILLACLTLFLSAPGFAPPAHAQTYYYRSLIQPDGSSGPPMPLDIYNGAEPTITLDATKQIYEILDDTNAYALMEEAMRLDATSASGSTMSADGIDPTDTNNISTNSPGDDYTNSFQPLVFGPNDLVIQITNVDLINQQVSLQLTNTQYGEHYQLLSTNTLANAPWTLGEVIIGAFGTNITPFSTFNIGTNSQMFFRAHHSSNEIAIVPVQNAIEPNSSTGDPGQTGEFRLYSQLPLANDLTVQYAVSGTAQPGTDYNALSGVATIPASFPNSTIINVVPINDNRVDGAESVTLTLLQNTNYLIDPNNSSATIYVEDSSQTIAVFPKNQFGAYSPAIEPNGPPDEPAQAGVFDFQRSDERNQYPDVVACFVISGTASNGVDYAYLTNTVDFTNGITDVFVDVNPLAQSVFDGTETVTVTLVPTNTYLVDSNNPSATLDLYDSSTTVSVGSVQDAIETNATTLVGSPGTFQVNRNDLRGDYPPLTVQYTLSGTATNGVDYQFLSGSVTFPDGEPSTYIFINTIEQDLIEPDETVILTLATNGTAYYVGNPFQTNLTIQTTVGFGTVIGNLNAPVGVDYYEPSNALIVSVAGSELFDMIHTNNSTTNVVATAWSGASGVSEETYFAIPRIPAGVFTNSAGFTNGTMFFGSDTNVGFVAPGGTNFNLDWANLTNTAVTNSLLLRGGFCMDQTGTFSNNIIIVTSPDSADPNTLKGVWSVDAHAKPRLINQIQTKHLEGVAVLTNDVQRWGPWAGKIITGDEDASELFAVDTNGVTPIDTHSLVSGGFPPENVQVIPPNSSLYVADNGNSAIMELPATYFRNHVGDLLVGDSFEGGGSGGFFILHWNTQGSNFVTTPIPMFGNSLSSILEGTTFAPVQLPNH